MTCAACGSDVGTGDICGAITHPGLPEGKLLIYHLCPKCGEEACGDHAQRLAVAEAVEIRLGLETPEAQA